MEGRLQGLVEDGDFYSAHQLLLSHSQKLERNGKCHESSKFLFYGIMGLAKTCAPAATLFDIVSKYILIVKKLDEDNIDLEAREALSQNILDILKITTGYPDVPQNLTNYWIDIAAFSLVQVAGEKVIKVLLDNIENFEQVLDFSTKFCQSDPQVYSILGTRVVTQEQFLQVALSLLKAKCFGSCTNFLKAFLLSTCSSKEGTVVSNCKVYSEDKLEFRAVNLITLLSELLRRRNPPRECFIQLQLRYSDILNNEKVKKTWTSIREKFWPPQVATPTSGQANPLASLFQSIMMNQ